ncbi:MAG: FixH family protein [Rhodobacteraceae bacterium]|nr:FixH family protein [Paracoccaceae bacterium]
MAETKPKEFTGKKMLLVMLSFFGVIITVNMFMAFSAVSTFPGLEVKNSYVASQEFNDRKRAQLALGWEVEFYSEGDEAVLVLKDAAGETVIPASITAKIGRPTSDVEDQTLDFRLVGEVYRAAAILPAGPWRLFLDAVAQDGTRYKKRLRLLVEAD